MKTICCVWRRASQQRRLVAKGAREIRGESEWSGVGWSGKGTQVEPRQKRHNSNGSQEVNAERRRRFGFRFGCRCWRDAGGSKMQHSTKGKRGWEVEAPTLKENSKLNAMQVIRSWVLTFIAKNLIGNILKMFMAYFEYKYNLWDIFDIKLQVCLRYQKAFKYIYFLNLNFRRSHLPWFMHFGRV